ncbi:MAG: electron transfer flavoprotein subunit alpha/FixB family protein [Solirubrobacterales bacterium]
MSSILVVAETRRGELREITKEVVGAALGLKEESRLPVAVALIASAPDRFLGAIPAGVDEVLRVESPAEHFEAHVHERALEQLIAKESPRLVLAGHTIDSFGFAPAVAARAGTGFASDVASIRWDDGPLVTRGAYGDKLVAELDFPEQSCVVLTLRPGAFAAAAAAGSVPVREVDLELAGAAATEHLRFEDAVDTGVDIGNASLLLSVGRGMDAEDELPRFEALAERLGGVLSVSRPLVDAGWVGSDRQVGQSGKTVRPRVYLALGISGAVQHLAGIREAETVVAVNLDPEAPIFGVADFGAVADLFDVADALEGTLG